MPGSVGASVSASNILHSSPMRNYGLRGHRATRARRHQRQRRSFLGRARVDRPPARTTTRGPALNLCGGIRCPRPRPERMRWWDREDPALVGPDHLPAPLMDVPVMAVAELDQILEVGVPAVSPVEDVVGVGPRRGTLAARPDAALVADPE